MANGFLQVRPIFKSLPPDEREETLQELSQPPPALFAPPLNIVPAYGPGSAYAKGGRLRHLRQRHVGPVAAAPTEEARRRGIGRAY